jgi:hypothetical protein
MPDGIIAPLTRECDWKCSFRNHLGNDDLHISAREIFGKLFE